jgi:hypothetical protein
MAGQNVDSSTVSGFVDGGSSLTQLGTTATNGDSVDAATAGRFLYVQTDAAEIVDEFQVEAGGASPASAR